MHRINGNRIAARRLVPAFAAAIIAASGAQAAPADGAAALNGESAQDHSARGPGDELATLRRELAEQRALIAEQGRQILAQQQQMDRLREQLSADGRLMDMRGMGLAQGSPTGQPAVLGGPNLPERPVGEAPPQTEVVAQVQAVPEGQGVLTPAGSFVFDPSIEYTRSSTNRLVFRGIELIPGIQIGLIEATDADRDTIVGTASLRYGVTDRLEVEARVPFLHRYDRIEVVQQRDEGIVRSISLDEDAIGDVEFALRYQLNRPVGQKPIWVANLRVKSDTGKSPFEVAFDEFGVATGLATGSGFWAVSPGINFLLPSDPVVIYGGASYLYHIPRDINKNIGEVFVGRVDPGDAIGGNIGFGFALNPRFSFSLGYRHNYIFKTTTELGDTVQKSRDLQVGSLNLGMSYRITERRTVNLGFEFGVTEDAPDVSLTLRMPFGFRAPWTSSRR